MSSFKAHVLGKLILTTIDTDVIERWWGRLYWIVLLDSRQTSVCWLKEESYSRQDSHFTIGKTLKKLPRLNDFCTIISFRFKNKQIQFFRLWSCQRWMEGVEQEFRRKPLTNMTWLTEDVVLCKMRSQSVFFSGLQSWLNEDTEQCIYTAM